MTTLQFITIAIVAIIHFYILILEMFLWTTKKGIKTFGLKDLTFAEATKVLAANQGLYNGFLAVGLMYSLFTESSEIAILFLIFVFVAGLYGAFSTKNKTILLVQSLPAFISLVSFYSFFF